MNLTLILLIVAFLALLIFWGAFRTWIGRQLSAIWLLAKHYFPVFFRRVVRILGVYSWILLIVALSAFSLVSVALLVNNPGFTAFAFVFALAIVMLAWLPAGIVLKLFRINSTVVPKTLKVFVAYVAFVGFVGLMYPEIISLKALLGVTLVGLICLGVTAQINVLDKIIFPLVVVMCLIAIWKHFSPDGFRSTVRYASSWSKQLNTSKDRGSIRNETNAAGTYGILLKDINVLYKLSGTRLVDAFMDLGEGTVVKIFNHKEEIQVIEGQGFIQIQLAKGNGSFVGGDKYLIEAEFVKLITPRELISESESNNPTDTVIVNPGVGNLPRDSIFTAGTYYINVKGETPFTINVVSVMKCNKYALASLTGNEYHIVYDNGVDIKDNPNIEVILPYWEEPKFVLRASEATVKMVVN